MRVANQLSGVTRRTVVAMALALAGVTLMLGAPNEGSLAGDGLSFVAALAFALMIVITRWRHDVSMAPATCVSRGILVAAFLPFASPGEIGGDDFIWLARLGIGQSGLGFALLTLGARLIPAVQVGLITLLEVLAAGGLILLAAFLIAPVLAAPAVSASTSGRGSGAKSFSGRRQVAAAAAGRCPLRGAPFVVGLKPLSRGGNHEVRAFDLQLAGTP
jgi:hypothetical protein